MNILFFSRFFYPHIGGVEKHVMKISKILIKKGHKITVVTEQHSRDLKTREIIEGIEVFRIPNLREGKYKKFQIWNWFWSNISLIRSADIIHCHDVFFWYLPFRFIFPFKKIFTTFHGYEDYPLGLKNIFVHKISERLSDGNICIGDFIKKWYGANPTIVSYGAVNIPKYTNLRSIKGKHSAVFAGRLDEQTGFTTYLDAFRQIRKRIPDFTLTVFGDGKFKPDMDGVEYRGFVNNAQGEIEKYNFAFASRYLSILEAMAVKRLVFAVYDNLLKEDYLRMAPFSRYILIFRSPSELVSKLSFYVDNPKEKEKLVENAFSWVKKHTWEEMTDAYVKLWGKNF